MGSCTECVFNDSLGHFVLVLLAFVVLFALFTYIFVKMRVIESSVS